MSDPFNSLISTGAAPVLFAASNMFGQQRARNDVLQDRAAAREQNMLQFILASGAQERQSMREQRQFELQSQAGDRSFALQREESAFARLNSVLDRQLKMAELESKDRQLAFENSLKAMSVAIDTKSKGMQLKQFERLQRIQSGADALKQAAPEARALLAKHAHSTAELDTIVRPQIDALLDNPEVRLAAGYDPESKTLFAELEGLAAVSDRLARITDPTTGEGMGRPEVKAALRRYDPSRPPEMEVLQAMAYAKSLSALGAEGEGVLDTLEHLGMVLPTDPMSRASLVATIKAAPSGPLTGDALIRYRQAEVTINQREARRRARPDYDPLDELDRDEETLERAARTEAYLSAAGVRDPSARYGVEGGQIDVDSWVDGSLAQITLAMTGRQGGVDAPGWDFGQRFLGWGRGDWFWQRSSQERKAVVSARMRDYIQPEVQRLKELQAEMVATKSLARLPELTQTVKSLNSELTRFSDGRITEFSLDLGALIPPSLVAEFELRRRALEMTVPNFSSFSRDDQMARIASMRLADARRILRPPPVAAGSSLVGGSLLGSEAAGGAGGLSGVGFNADD